MGKKPAVLLAVLLGGVVAAYAALDWMASEPAPNDLRDAAASIPAPAPMFVAGGMGIAPGMPYALPAAPRRLLASADR